MKGKLGKISSILAIVVLIVAVLPVFAQDVPGEPHAPDAMWIEPSSINLETATTAKEDNFTITVYLNAANDVASWQFSIVYDNTWLNAISCVYSGTDGAKSQLFEKSGTTTIGLSPTFGPDFVLFAESYMSGPYGPANDPSSLAYVTFEITDVPSKGETFTSDLAFDYDETYYQDPAANYYKGIGIDGEVTFIWTAPSPPHMAVVPPVFLFDEYTDWVGTTFDVGLYIEDLSSAWELINASFTLFYDNALITPIAVVFDPLWNVDASYTDGDGSLEFYVETSALPSNPLVATVAFEIIYQGVYPDVDASPLDFVDVALFYSTGEIPTADPENGTVTIVGYLAAAKPWLEVVPNEVTLGPAPSIGEEFTVNITIKSLHFSWYLVGLDFRLYYCPDLLEVVSCEEGPYLKQFNQTPTEPYTIFKSFTAETNDGTYIAAMDLILPNATGHYPAPVAGAEPPEDGTIAVVTFKAIKQDNTPKQITYSCNLTLQNIMMLDKDGGYVPYDTPVNCTYKILSSYAMGRFIDVYTQYPAPYGGHGFNMSSDMFWPQKQVVLYADVTYNRWPVQNKLVTFTVYRPPELGGAVWTVLQGITNDTGVACVNFTMPWTCGPGWSDPTDLFGVWTVIAEVDIACEIVRDELRFHYNYLISGINVTINPAIYDHTDNNEVIATVEFYSHRQQDMNVKIWVVIHDELNVPVAIDKLEFTIGGGWSGSIYDEEFCTPDPYEEPFSLTIPKFAYAGTATVHAIPFMLWQGNWYPAGPEGIKEILILPI